MNVLIVVLTEYYNLNVCFLLLHNLISNCRSLKLDGHCLAFLFDLIDYDATSTCLYFCFLLSTTKLFACLLAIFPLNANKLSAKLAASALSGKPFILAQYADSNCWLRNMRPNTYYDDSLPACRQANCRRHALWPPSQTTT